MALNFYCRLTGQTQGEIKGSVTQVGREDSIMGIGFSHAVLSPRDAASGMATGKRQHLPAIMTKEIDKSTPLIANALYQNELLTTVEFRFWQPSPAGAEIQHYTIELANATIAEIRTEMLNNKYAENMPHKEREHVSFTYGVITQTWEDGGLTSTDNWESPVV